MPKKQLILVAGGPDQGKSYFLEQVEKRYGSIAVSINYDQIRMFLAAHPREFFTALGRTDPNMLRGFGAAGTDILATSDAVLESRFNQFRERDEVMGIGTSEVLHKAAFSELVHRLYNAGRKAPVVEYIDLMTQEKRLQFYHELQRTQVKMGIELELSEREKSIVYFDQGLDRSVANARRQGYSKPHSLPSYQIEWMLRGQELPFVNELPNLDIMILRNPREVEKFLDHMFPQNARRAA